MFNSLSDARGSLKNFFRRTAVSRDGKKFDGVKQEIGKAEICTGEPQLQLHRFLFSFEFLLSLCPSEINKLASLDATLV